MLGLAGIPLGLELRFLDPSPDAPAAAVGDAGRRRPRRRARAPRRRRRRDRRHLRVGGRAGGRRAVPRRPARHGPPRSPATRGRAGPPRSRRRPSARSGSARPRSRASTPRRRSRGGRHRRRCRRCSRPAAADTTARASACCATPADLDGAWDASARRRCILERSCPSTASSPCSRYAALDGTIACWPLVENEHADGILRVSRAPAPGARRRAAGARRGGIATRSSPSSTTSACSRSSCSTSAASCSRTRSHPACTTRATGRSRAPRRASSRTTSAPCSGCRSDRPRRAGTSAMVNCVGTLPDRDAVLAVPGAHLHDYGKAPRAGPQARPRHARRRHRRRATTLDRALRRRSARLASA